MSEERWRHWKRIDESKCLVMYTIYDKPKDYPDRFVVRRWRIVGPKVTPEAVPMLADDIEDARSCIPPGTVCMERYLLDDPNIVETWV